MKQRAYWRGVAGGLLLLLLTGLSWAAPRLNEPLTPGTYPLQAITNHTPTAFENSDDYWKSLQEIKLEIGNQQQFRDLPKLGLKQPFTGKITLGDRPQQCGVIVDFSGEEKRLYIDRDGDGSFANEPYTLLLNEWQGLQAYWVLGPEPVTVQVSYNSAPDQHFPLELAVGGIINKPGAYYKEEPYLRIWVRTWFLARVPAAGLERLVAVVDRDNNGRFNDPQDQAFIDFDDNGYFSADEAVTRKRQVQLKDGSQRLTLDWQVYPGQLVIGGKE